MQPEISRRCLSCGAAVRAGARFCPQCGAQAADAGAAAAAAQESVAPESREVETPRGVAPTSEVESLGEIESAREWTPPTREFAAFAQSFEGVGTGAAQAGETSAGAQPQAAESPGLREGDTPRRAEDSSSFEDSPPSGVPSTFEDSSSSDAPPSYVAAASPGAYEGAGDVRGRVARVREGTRARVERMRDEAIVVLEEKPDDSGLRFVIAAAALFLVFLLLLFLSTTVLR